MFNCFSSLDFSPKFSRAPSLLRCLLFDALEAFELFSESVFMADPLCYGDISSTGVGLCLGETKPLTLPVLSSSFAFPSEPYDDCLRRLRSFRSSLLVLFLGTLIVCLRLNRSPSALSFPAAFAFSSSSSHSLSKICLRPNWFRNRNFCTPRFGSSSFFRKTFGVCIFLPILVAKYG